MVRPAVSLLRNGCGPWGIGLASLREGSASFRQRTRGKDRIDCVSLFPALARRPWLFRPIRVRETGRDRSKTASKSGRQPPRISRSCMDLSPGTTKLLPTPLAWSSSPDCHREGFDLRTAHFQFAGRPERRCGAKKKNRRTVAITRVGLRGIPGHQARESARTTKMRVPRQSARSCTELRPREPDPRKTPSRSCSLSWHFPICPAVDNQGRSKRCRLKRKRTLRRALRR